MITVSQEGVFAADPERGCVIQYALPAGMKIVDKSELPRFHGETLYEAHQVIKGLLDDWETGTREQMALAEVKRLVEEEATEQGEDISYWNR